MKNSSSLLILNPVSGKKEGNSKVKSIINFFKNYNIELEVFCTRYKGHARKYLQMIDSNLFSNIIVYGGDGTFNEVINGIMCRKDQYMPTFGFLPGGSGNSVMYHLNKLNIDDACNLIIQNHIKKIDVMKIEYNNTIEYSINIVGWGMVGDIANLSEKMRWLGPSRYNIASLIYIIINKNRYADIVIDGITKSDNYLFVLIANTKYTGKGMIVAPNAELNDGLIDLIVVKNNINKIELAKLLPRLFTGDHIYSQHVEYKQIEQLHIKPKQDEFLNIDGEIHGSTPVKISVLPKTLNIFN